MNGFSLELGRHFLTSKSWGYSWLRKNTSIKTWICWLWSLRSLVGTSGALKKWNTKWEMPSTVYQSETQTLARQKLSNSLVLITVCLLHISGPTISLIRSKKSWVHMVFLDIEKSTQVFSVLVCSRWSSVLCLEILDTEERYSRLELI